MHCTIDKFAVILLAGAIHGCGDGKEVPVKPTNSDGPQVLVEHLQGDGSALADGFAFHRGRDPDAPSRVNRQPVVIDDPAEIERTREVFAEGLDRLYTDALARIKRGEWVEWAHDFVLRQRRIKAIDDLAAIVDKAGMPSAARTRAAEKLVMLEEPAGERFLFESLASPSAELRLAAATTLREGDVPAGLTEPDRVARMLALLDDENEELVAVAAGLCVDRSIPGTEEKLVSLLEGRQLTDEPAIAQRLAEVATTRRAVDVILKHLFQETSSQYNSSTGYTLRKLLVHPDAALSEPVRKALHSYTLQFDRLRYDQLLVDDLAKSADEESIPVLEDILNNAKDPVSRIYAVGALARLQPEKAVDLLLKHIKRDGPRSELVGLLRRHASESDFDRVAPVVLWSLKESRRPFDTEIVRLFLVELGERGRQVVEDQMHRLTEEARMWATWKLQGIDLRTALWELQAAGVVESGPDELIGRMRNEQRAAPDSASFDPSEPSTLLGALVVEGIVTYFDVETGVVPCDHDRLILQFAAASRGRFGPQWPVQFWHRQNKDDYNAPYTVQFVYGDRLFRVGAENYGDWYDVEAVVRLMNFALETAGRLERFITLENQGQYALFVFADPEAFIPIANKYCLPLSEDASKAMRQGIEFEKRVFDRRK